MLRSFVRAMLFLEDIGTKPYQWDRMLLHLRYSGRLDDVRGIVFGDMAQCVPDDERDLLERAILHGLRGFPGRLRSVCAAARGWSESHVAAGSSSAARSFRCKESAAELSCGCCFGLVFSLAQCGNTFI